MSSATTPPTPPSIRMTVVGVSWPLETFIERLLVGLAARNVEVTLRSRHRPSTAWLRRTGVHWVRGGRMDAESLRSQLRHNGYVGAARAVGAEVASRLRGGGDGAPECDVVYVPWLTTLMADPDLFDLGVPVVTSCRGSLVNVAPWDPGRPDYRHHLSEVFEQSARVHCVSLDILDRATSLGLDPAKARVIRPAVDPTEFRARLSAREDDHPTSVVSVGTLLWLKDLEHALVGFRRAVDQGADLRFDVVGDGPDLQHVRYTVDDLGLSDRVSLLGRLPPDRVAQVLRRADVFLHTSSAEGISNAVLEAMASGLPVITTDAGGMREAVRDGIDGFVVAVRGTDEVARSLVALTADGELRRRMGASARARILDGFRLEQQIESFRELLADAVASGAKR